MCIKELEYRTQLSGIFLPLDGAFKITSTKNFPLKLGFTPEIKIIWWHLIPPLTYYHEKSLPCGRNGHQLHFLA